MFRYYFNIDQWKCSSTEWIYALRCLPSNHLDVLRRFHYQRDVKFALIGQILIRYLLSRVFEKKSSVFVLQRDHYGRPMISSESHFDFNLSHANALVAIVGTDQGRVGCDTNLYRSRSHKRLHRPYYHLLKEKILNKDELNYLQTSTSTDLHQLALFLRFWSLKESYVKWLGQGLRYPVKDLHFSLSSPEDFPSRTARLRSNEDLRFDEELIALNNSFDDEQLITVCLSSSNPFGSFRSLTIDDLLHQCSPFDERRNEEDLQRSWKEFLQKDSAK